METEQQFRDWLTTNRDQKTERCDGLTDDQISKMVEAQFQPFFGNMNISLAAGEAYERMIGIR